MWYRFLICSILALSFADDSSAGYLAVRQSGPDFGVDSLGSILLAESTGGTIDFSLSSDIGLGGRFIDASGEIANGAIRLRLHNRGSFGRLGGSVSDQYLLAGPAGETVPLTAYLEVDGFTQYFGSGSGTIVGGRIGADYQEDGFGTTFPTFAQSDSTTPSQASQNVDKLYAHDFSVSYTFDATVGVPFQLAYHVFIANGKTPTSPLPSESILTDLTNTATVRFDLPDEFSLMSQNGFGAPTASAEVPEPGSMTLLGTGLLSACWFRRRRGDKASRIELKPISSQVD